MTDFEKKSTILLEEEVDHSRRKLLGIRTEESLGQLVLIDQTSAQSLILQGQEPELNLFSDLTDEEVEEVIERVRSGETIEEAMENIKGKVFEALRNMTASRRGFLRGMGNVGMQLFGPKLPMPDVTKVFMPEKRFLHPHMSYVPEMFKPFAELLFGEFPDSQLTAAGPLRGKNAVANRNGVIKRDKTDISAYPPEMRADVEGGPIDFAAELGLPFDINFKNSRLEFFPCSGDSFAVLNKLRSVNLSVVLSERAKDTIQVEFGLYIQGGKEDDPYDTAQRIFCIEKKKGSSFFELQKNPSKVSVYGFNPQKIQIPSNLSLYDFFDHFLKYLNNPQTIEMMVKEMFLKTPAREGGNLFDLFFQGMKDILGEKRPQSPVPEIPFLSDFSFDNPKGFTTAMKNARLAQEVSQNLNPINFHDLLVVHPDPAFQIFESYQKEDPDRRLVADDQWPKNLEYPLDNSKVPIFPTRETPIGEFIEIKTAPEFRRAAEILYEFGYRNAFKNLFPDPPTFARFLSDEPERQRVKDAVEEIKADAKARGEKIDLGPL